MDKKISLNRDIQAGAGFNLASYTEGFLPRSNGMATYSHLVLKLRTCGVLSPLRPYGFMA